MALLLPPNYIVLLAFHSEKSNLVSVWKGPHLKRLKLSDDAEALSTSGVLEVVVGSYHCILQL